MQNNKKIYNVTDIQSLLSCGQNKAYQIIKTLNDELLADGSNIIAGKIPAQYFHKRYKGFSELES